jgi:chemotaxis protein MotB
VSKSDKKAPIIIKKKVVGHGGHHGGSWKVAYADFVTAMMAFFMVMWIMGMDQGARDIIEGYFTNPVGFKKAYGGGQNPLSAGNSISPMQEGAIAMLVRDAQERQFHAVAEGLKGRLAAEDELKELAQQVAISVDKDGMRIELLERDEHDSFFMSGSPSLTVSAARALNIIGEGLAGLPNKLVIEGHTDAVPMQRGGYSNWELSSERANSARRVLEVNGVAPLRVQEVRGYADRKPRIATDPRAPSNRRISILLPYAEPPGPAFTAGRPE